MMNSLPIEIERQCRQVLLKCSEFDSDTLLKAVFTTSELSPFKFRLKSADSQEERVVLCLEYLLKNCLSDGSSVLPFFLVQLRDRYDQMDALHGELAELCEDVQAVLRNSGSLTEESNFEKLQKEFIAASQGLLNWPITLGNNQQIERPEFQQLVARIQEEKRSTTLILGSPGTGKSALLATLGHHLAEHQISLWAIKADQLGRGVNTLEDLCRPYLTINPRDAIRILAKKEPVVLLIDQLDAVSELLDRQSERLNILLNLIQSLSGTSGVHIIATSREFEFRHDVRLSCIKAERMDLQLPKWEQIAPILDQGNHNPNSMGQPLRELLQTPLYLKLFLEVAAPGEEFNSLQALLNQLWNQQVVDPDGPSDRRELLELLADRISTQEEFWLPTAIAEDTHSLACRALEQAEILTRSPNGLTIGFRHQTYYDYTQARAFARGSVALTDYVLQRQDGLFVRPVLLSSLNYLRETSRKEYHIQLQRLLQSELRLHIRTLLLEFVGGQKDPDDTEAHIFLPLLKSETEGQRLLAAVSGSPGWFFRLRDRPDFRQWLDKSPEQAVYCLPLLSLAILFSPEDVLELLEECWLSNRAYDTLSFRILVNLQQWTDRVVTLASQIVRRSQTSKWDISALAEQIAENSPELAPNLWRAYLDWQLEQALTKANEPLPELPSNATEEQRAVHTYIHRSFKEVEYLIKGEKTFYKLEGFAEATPKAFLDSVWPWFLDTINLIAYQQENSFFVGYRDDSATNNIFQVKFPPGAVVRALLVAVSELAKQNIHTFLNFLDKNLCSDLLIVHRLLARGLEYIAKEKPQQVLEYLIGDPRRLRLGDHEDHYRETKRLIASVFPYLAPLNRTHLEEVVIAFKHYNYLPSQLSAKEKFQFLKFQRQNRLRLLRAFPVDYLSSKTKRLRDEEERALPETDDYTSRMHGGFIGARITVDEMAHASDEDILRLFDLIPDQTAWDNPRRPWSEDMSRAGGVVELSREFGKLAKRSPERVTNLIQYLKSGKHEICAGAAIEGLAETDFSTADLIHIIEDLESQGFTSVDFRSSAASALEKRARCDNGLPSIILSCLEKWLAEEVEPTLSTEEQETRNKTEQQKEPIFFGSDGTFFLLQGRGSILPAIAAGYLNQPLPDLENWIRIIEEQLQREQHPKLWVLTLVNMPALLNSDRERATQLYDAVIQTCPAVLHYKFALYSISRVIGYFEPKEKIQGWIEKLSVDGSSFCLQAYGELLLIYYCQYQDTWSRQQIDHHLTDPNDEIILYGLAQAASYLWEHKFCRKIATTILCTLALSPSPSIQDAVANVFSWNQNNFKLNLEMREVIQVVCKNPPLLLKAAYNLIELLEPETGREPDLVSQVCQAILDAASSNINNATTSLPLETENLTNIALTLHRQEIYRERGLYIFEKLLSLNLIEARVALEVLDRKPNQVTFLSPRRRRMRRETS
ncbi:MULTISPECIES: ATP-binding protein [unclassified Microcoleus]|uniref:ATP-binding protein n=1 Tax=unclassified Microcoleus TaxID=2642155 RepID=UPI002FD73169